MTTIRFTQIVLVQIEYGKVRKKSLRHKVFPRHLSRADRPRVDRVEQKDSYKNGSHETDGSQLESRESIPTFTDSQSRDRKDRQQIPAD